MILRAYTIYDLKALQYHPPFFASTDGAAMRMVADLVNDPSTTVGRHPADYVLFACGEWDDQLGQFDACLLRHVADAVSFVRVTPDMFAAAQPQPKELV